MSRIRFRLRPLFLGIVVLLLDCAPLDKLTPNACGNGVVDDAEDCDTFPNDAADKTHARCGAPTDGDLACHLRCGLQADGVTSLVCPEGWGCDVKHVCRQPTGEFDDALGAVSGGAKQLQIGDFDGDGRRDLVASGLRDRSASRLRVHYFDDLGGLAQVALLPAAAVAPAVFDHDHDGRDAIAFGLIDPNRGGSLGVVSGLADRTFLPVVFPSATLPSVEAAPVFVFPQVDNVRLPTAMTDREDNSILILLKDPSAGALLRSLNGELNGGSKLNRVIPDGPAPSEVRGAMVSARVFDGSTTSACGEVVIAAQVAAGPRVFVISPCRIIAGTGRSGWDSASPGGLTSIVIPQALGDRGVLVADLDGDQHLDILVDTVTEPFVMYGNATGTGLSTPALWKPTVMADPALTAPVGMPLAAGDLNLDGKADLVFGTGVATRTTIAVAGDAGAPSAGDGTYAFTFADGQRTWTDAVVGHFGADLLPDVVTATFRAPDLQVYISGAGGKTTVTSVTTNGVVEAFVKGDFDGDHIDDVAIAESTALPDKSDLSIAYGRPFGGLEPPQRIGTVDKSKGLAVVPHGAAPADLGSFSFYRAQATGPQSTAFTVLVGSSERQPLAPLFFIESLSCTRDVTAMEGCMPKRVSRPGDANRQWLPFALAAGPLGDPTNQAVLAYAAGVGGAGGLALGVWVANATTTGLGGLEAPKEQQVLDSGGFSSDLYDLSSRAAKIVTATRDIDSVPDGLAEVIVATNAQNATDAMLMVVHPTHLHPDTQSSAPGLRMGTAGQIETVDLDGDGLFDAVVRFDLPAPGKIVAFLNDGNGGFSNAGITLTLPPPPAGTADPGNPVAFAAIPVRGAPVAGAAGQTNALAVLTEHSVVLATLRPDKQGFDVKPLASHLTKTNIEGATGIAAGDFNGDGLQDIAIANGGITLLLQAARRTGK
jgi:hypothetical protein